MKTTKDFDNEENPITAWCFYEVFERKHCGTGWLRAQMCSMEHELDQLKSRTNDLQAAIDYEIKVANKQIELLEIRMDQTNTIKAFIKNLKRMIKRLQYVKTNN